MFDLNNLSNGGFFVKSDFLKPEDFSYIKKEIKNIEYNSTYQPISSYYGNRYQAYPCYENRNVNFDKFFLPKFKENFGKKIKKVSSTIRKVLSKELLQSKVNTNIGLIHTDGSKYAAIFYFDQTSNGGTAFFQNTWDKYPDVTIGSYPNRLVVYSGKKPHAPMHDFSFEERYIIAYFIE